MGHDSSIESVPLYTELDRINKELANIGIGPNDSIKPEQLFAVDQWHYHGPEAIGAAANALRLEATSHVLDVGAGVGGPARFLAHTTGCHVTALELQSGLNAIGADLTRRCGLGERVTHICGDALTYPLPDAGFDAIVSFLAIVHIPNRPQLCARLARALRPGGACYIEDLCMRAPFASDDLRDLREVVFGLTVTSIDDYVSDTRTAGFKDVVADDMTSDWAPYASQRLAAWRANREAYAKVHGEGAYVALEKFYAVVAHLYDSGSLGGVRLMART